MSWFLEPNSQSEQGLTKSETELSKIPDQSENSYSLEKPFNFRFPKGKFGLCYCPGKNLKKGRDNKEHRRNLRDDLTYFRELKKVGSCSPYLEPS